MANAEEYNFDQLIANVKEHRDFPKEMFEKWVENNIKDKDVEKLREPFKKYVTDKIHEYSDNVPNGPALNNKFFKFWTSDKPEDKLSPEGVRSVLANFRALTDMTRHAVAVSFLAAHGNIVAETRAGANLGEESGDGDPEKAHFKYLNKFIESTLEHVGARHLSVDKINNSPEILPQTRKSMQEEQDLYMGKFVTERGIEPTLVVGGHPLNVTAGIAAVSAAHESKAPGMLAMLLEGVVKHLDKPTDAQKEGVAKYFEEHLGDDVTKRILEGEKISKTLIEENQKVKGWSSDKLRQEGYIEQAHRKDANDSTVDIVMSQKTTDGKKVDFFDNVQAFVAAKAGFEKFAKTHGDFWEGVYDGIILEIKKQPQTTDGKEVDFFDNVQASVAAKAGFEKFTKADGNSQEGVYDGTILEIKKQPPENSEVGTTLRRGYKSLEDIPTSWQQKNITSKQRIMVR